MPESTHCIGQQKEVKLTYAFRKLNLHILICVHIACKHAPFLSAWTSRYCLTPILHQHAKSHNLSQMKKKNPQKISPQV